MSLKSESGCGCASTTIRPSRTSSSSSSATYAAPTVVEITSETQFHDLVAGSTGIVVVDFFTTWCNPCKRLAPQLQQLSRKYPNVLFLKVDADQFRELAVEQHGVQGFPTFCFYKNQEQALDFTFSGADIRRVESVITTLEGEEDEEEREEEEGSDSE